MSRSSRQIGHPKELPRDLSSVAFTHRRNGSVESRNFGQLLELGRKYYQNSQMQQAVQILQRGLYYDPLNVELNYLLGVAFLSLQGYGEALRHLNQVVKVNASYKPNLYLLLSITHKKMGSLQLALKSASLGLQSNQDVQCRFYRAKILFALAQIDQALADISHILEKDPKNGSAYILKIECLAKSGQYDQALQIAALAKNILDDVSKLLQISIKEAKVYSKIKKYDAALKAIENIQTQFPSIPPELEILKANVLKGKGLTQQALMIYNQLLGKNCSSLIYSEAIAEAAIICMRERDFYEAFAYLKRTQMMKIKSKANDQLLRLAEGMTFLMKKKYAEGIVLMGSCLLNFRYSLKCHLRFLQNLLNNALAFANFNLGDHLLALSLYQKILPQQSTDMIASSYNISICRGIIKYNEGRHEESLLLFEQAKGYIKRPEPYFYMAVIMNEQYLKESIDTDGFVKILELIEKGLRCGQNADMYYYRAMIYLYIGMNSQALEDIDRAIQKSEDNVAKYFHARGVIFFLDKNYDQALMQFGTALSIDENYELSIIEKAKCELLSNDPISALTTIEQTSKCSEWTTLFLLHERQYQKVLQGTASQSIKQVCYLMEGKFEEAGPSGKLILAILYQNYNQVLTLIDQAIGLGVSIGSLEANDLLILKAFCEYRLGKYEESLLSLNRVENCLRETNSRSDTYNQEEQRKLLMCRVNAILVNVKRDHQLEAIGLTEQLLSQVCEGPIFDELLRLQQCLRQQAQHEIEFNFNSMMLSDFFGNETCKGLTFKFLIPMPHHRVLEVQCPQFQQLLTEFTVKDIQNKPEAPWIKRGQYGLIFTNDVRQYQNLNLKTEENQGIKSRMPTSQSRVVVKKRSQLIEQLKLSTSVLSKLQKIAKKATDN